MNYRILVLFIGLIPLGISCSSPRAKKHAAPPPTAETQVPDSKEETLDSMPNGNAAPEMAATPAFLNTGSKTKYQTISEGFDHSEFPAELTDFDALDEPNPKTSCFTVQAVDPNAMSGFVIKQMMVQLEGSPDYGPLFPGSTDRVEPRLVIGKDNGWVNSQNLTNEKRQVFGIGRMANALVIRISENKFGIYQDVGAPAEVWIRKNRYGLLFFRVYKVDLMHKRNEVFSGYCFHK